jgi:hypothetical protein
LLEIPFCGEVTFNGQKVVMGLWFSIGIGSPRSFGLVDAGGGAGHGLQHIYLLANFKKVRKKKYRIYSDAALAVFTYRIKRKDVGIIINKAVAIKPRIFTSMEFLPRCVYK